MKLVRKISIVTAVVSTCASFAFADAPYVTIVGRPTTVVVSNVIRLSEIADIKAPDAISTDTLAILSNTKLGESPAPGVTKQIAGEDILQLMRASGIDVSKLRYTFPQMTRITRAGRPATDETIRPIIQSYLDQTSPGTEIQAITIPANTIISAGEVRFGVEPSRSSPRGKDFIVTATDTFGTAVKFVVSCRTESWGDVPVAGRSFGKGSVIGQNDVTMARMNLAQIPNDVIYNSNEIIGRQVSGAVASGQPLRRGQLAMPTMITAGSKVTLVFKSGLLEASATGIAMESAPEGAKINIRNDVSKKTVVGTAIATDMVSVADTSAFLQ